MDEQWIQTASRALAAAGYRAGGARQAMLEGLARSGGGLSAPDLWQQIQAGRPVAIASVYRILSDLEQVGVVRRVDLGHAQARYELVRPDGRHHHHVVCDECGRTDVFDDPALEQAVHEAEQRQRFAIHAHDIVLHGRCEDCAHRPGGAVG